MSANELFINKSIDLHLYFLRITEEHFIFIQSSLPAKNVNLKQEGENIRQELLKLFSYIMSISGGRVSQMVINSDELITRYTYDAEKLSEYYTGIEIDSNYTIYENNILTNSIAYTQISTEQMINLNNTIINIVKKVIDYQSKILEEFLNCKIFTSIIPDRLDHIIDEGKHYIVEIEKLQKMELMPTLDSLNEEMIFWNENLSDHGLFTALRLDPSEKKMDKEARDFSNNFERLADEAQKARNNPISTIDVLNRSLQEVLKYKESNTIEIEKLLSCKVKSILLPLGSEHDLRELNHYLRILYEGKKYLNV